MPDVYIDIILRINYALANYVAAVLNVSHDVIVSSIRFLFSVDDLCCENFGVDRKRENSRIA